MNQDRSASALLARLAAAGVNVEPNPDPRLVTVAPMSRLTPELRAEIVEHKAELLELLAARVPPSSAWADPGPPPVERPPSDPRPELVEDSLAWSHLLAHSAPDRCDARGLFGVLHGARCGGAALKFKQGRWRLEPPIDPTEMVSIWHDQAAWDADRGRYLLPHRQRLTKLLRLLPTPSRLSAPPSEVEAGVAALRALGWRFVLKPEGGLSATSSSPEGLREADLAWARAHVDHITELLRGEGE